jgi:hypothetical protein
VRKIQTSWGDEWTEALSVVQTPCMRVACRRMGWSFSPLASLKCLIGKKTQAICFPSRLESRGRGERRYEARFLVEVGEAELARRPAGELIVIGCTPGQNVRCLNLASTNGQPLSSL